MEQLRPPGRWTLQRNRIHVRSVRRDTIAADQAISAPAVGRTPDERVTHVLAIRLRRTGREGHRDYLNDLLLH